MSHTNETNTQALRPTHWRKAASWIVAAGLLAASGLALANPTRASGNVDPKTMTGPALADSLGLVPAARPLDGEAITSSDDGVFIGKTRWENCPPKDALGMVVVVQQTDDGQMYCIAAASRLEAWGIGQRLNGHLPSEDEVAFMRVALADESASLSPDAP